ncbi:alpha/beta hydrolase family protein [Streptomyces sp. XM4193]|nr:alpha/beta hydrolase family protein [Streptomyces sp. XM4193]
MDLSNPLAGLAVPHSGERAGTGWRVALTIAVVFVLLATAGWTAVQNQHRLPSPREAALSVWAESSLEGRPLPDPEARPAEVRRFFRSLSTNEQRGLAEEHPLIVGNLNGVPVRLRYEANRLALHRAVAVERERKTDERLTEAGQHDAGRRMNRFTSLLEGDRQILAFDPTGRGRAAEVFGNLEKAERVSVIVPGVDTELLTFERTQLKYTAPVGMAQAVYESGRRQAPEVGTATIAWADYTAPRGVGMSAATGDLAEDGATRLNELLRALPGDSTVALMCHSYGSVVCGVAGPRSPARVTDVVVAGSPGMRLDSASELGGSRRLWAMRAQGDWIADVPHLNFGGIGHGADPAEPGFGSRRLATADASGHTAYFEPGTGALANLAAVGTGSYGSTTSW